MHQKPFVGWEWGPAGELTMLPETPSWIGDGSQRSVQEKGKAKRWMEAEKREYLGKKGRGNGRGKEGTEGD